MKESELYVFGAGQMRTGTNSLKLALEKLYGGKCYHMIELVENHRDHVHLWNKTYDQGSLNKKMCDQIFQGYCAAVDYPAAPFYKDLMKIYPKAKIILTTRETNSWIKSVRNTTYPSSGSFNKILNFTLLFSGLRSFIRLREKMLNHAFHVPKNELDRNDDLLKKVYEKYNEEVINNVPKERLLIFNISDGWEPLCDFLDLPVPDEPFPHVNSTDEFQERVKKRRNVTILKSGLVLAVLALSASIFMKFILRFDFRSILQVSRPL